MSTNNPLPATAKGRLEKLHTEENAPNLGRRLRELRLKAGLSQRDLADKLGLSHTTVSKYESGARVPTPGALATASHVLSVPLWRLYFTPAQFDDREPCPFCTEPVDDHASTCPVLAGAAWFKHLESLGYPTPTPTLERAVRQELERRRSEAPA